LLDSEVIILHIGISSSQRRFQVHKSLLSSNSPLWADYFSSLPDPEQDLTDLDFVDEDPSIFALLVEWLYHGSIPSLPSPSFPLTQTTIPSTHKTQLLKTLTKIAKTQLGQPFRAPVSEIWPEYADRYAEKIELPIDLSTILSKLQADKYATIDELKSEFDLLYNNAVLFNGLNHSVTSTAIKLRAKVLEKIEAIETVEQVPASPQLSNIRDSVREGGGETNRELRHTLQKLICLSECYRFDALSAICMDALIPLYKAHRLYPSSDTISYIYSNTVAGSKLRLYVARALAHMIVSKAPDAQGEGRELGVRTEWIWDVMKENEELGVEVLGNLRGKNGVLVGEAEDAGCCEYHWHGEAEVCPLAGKRVHGVEEVKRM